VGGFVKFGNAPLECVLGPQQIEHLLAVQPALRCESEDLHQAGCVTAAPAAVIDRGPAEHDLEPAKHDDLHVLHPLSLASRVAYRLPPP
jgi:hypothetical protein